MFLFGAVENEEEVLPLFDVVVCLVADGDTLRDRLTSRQGNDFGKGRGDIDHVLSWLEFYEDRHREIGAVMVDATQPLTAVAQAVVKAAHTAS